MTITPVEVEFAIRDRDWYGYSGIQYSGEAVARHLEGARTRLAADGWLSTRPTAEYRTVVVSESTPDVRATYDSAAAALAEATTRLGDAVEDEATSLRGLVRAGLRAALAWVRLEHTDYPETQTRTVRVEAPGHTFREAVHGGVNMSDLGRVADRVMGFTIRERSGGPGGGYLSLPHMDEWAGVPGRTQAEVLQLLADAAAFARTHGPS